MPPLVDGALAIVPVWLIITPLVGVVNGALFFLLAGRRPSSLGIYVPLAAVAASLPHAVGLTPIGSPPWTLGEVHLVAASVGAWSMLALVRLAGR